MGGRVNISADISVHPPLIPLSDGAGEAVHIGSAVQRFRVGDLVVPVYLPDWIDGPVMPRAGRRRLGGLTDGVLAEFTCDREHVCGGSHPGCL
jgi:NADPH:quinone reductase-like Zn-dependent oxidoreductase